MILMPAIISLLHNGNKIHLKIISYIFYGNTLVLGSGENT
jgi:hypothetical protein